MAEIRMKLRVNGRPVCRTVRADMRLLDFLREELNLTGTKEGCGEGECGTCSVLVGGEAVKSCLMTIPKVQGAEIVTVEGLAQGSELTPVQQAFVHTGASQCGFCIPGMVIVASALLKHNPDAGDDQIRQSISGNICRCTGYRKIFEAVGLARDVMGGRLPAAALRADPGEAPPPSYVGASVERIDAPSKVTGALRYAADLKLPGILHVRVLRSPHAHARILSVDIREAEALPGVEAVLTHRDVPGEDGHGVVVDDQPAFARDRVRFAGEGIAAVVADSPRTAGEALARIKVEYEPLPGVFSPHEAMAADAPALHAAFPGNVLKHVKIRRGDTAAIGGAEMVVEETYRTQAIEHAYLEPEAGIAYIEPDGTLTVVSPSQNITHHRRHLCKLLGLPPNRVRCVMSPVGGGFGGKEDMTVQHVLALAALKTRQPVKYVFTREESFLASAKRHPFEVRYRTGLARDGRIVACECRILADGGAYAFSSPAVMVKAAILACGPYRIDNVQVDSIAVYTNNTPSGAMRGFGATQMHFATEAHMDLCAGRLAMDPIEFRRLNALRDGDQTHTRQTLPSVSLLRTLDAAAAADGWAQGGAAEAARVEVTRR